MAKPTHVRCNDALGADDRLLSLSQFLRHIYFHRKLQNCAFAAAPASSSGSPCLEKPARPADSTFNHRLKTRTISEAASKHSRTLTQSVPSSVPRTERASARRTYGSSSTTPGTYLRRQSSAYGWPRNSSGASSAPSDVTLAPSRHLSSQRQHSALDGDVRR